MLVPYTVHGAGLNARMEGVIAEQSTSEATGTPTILSQTDSIMQCSHQPQAIRITHLPHPSIIHPLFFSIDVLISTQ
jgi:phosphoribosylcarboxyaminoimidazole (NCAIR) mutase